MIDDGNKLRNELTKLTKQAVQQTKKYQLLEQNKANVESDRLVLKIDGIYCFVTYIILLWRLRLRTQLR